MAYETIGDLIKAFREDEKDQSSPYFWSDPQLVRFASGALVAFADKTKSILDLVEVDFAAGDEYLPFAEYIIDVMAAEIEIGDRLNDLEVVSPVDVRQSRLPSGGRPVLLITGAKVGQMRLVPVPKMAGRVLLQVARRPVKEAAKDTKLTDVNPAHREYLLLFIKHRAYNVHDAELFDAAKASGYLIEFNAECQRIYEDELRRRGGARRIRAGAW